MSEFQIPRGHETPHASVRGVLITGLALAILVGVLLAGLWLWVRANGEASPPPEEGPVATTVPLQQAPLNPDQRAQRERYEIQQRELLSTFGWIDREKGVARIPIDDAVRRLVAERTEAKP